MIQEQVTLDQAIQNLERILAHILIEQDIKSKGVQIGHGWQQLGAIKQAVANLSFLNRRHYKKEIIPMENKLKLYEDSFISEVDLQLVIEDVQTLNDLMIKYKQEMVFKRKEEMKSKMIIIRTELERVLTKNQHRNNQPKWSEYLQNSQQLLIQINNILNANSDNQIMASVCSMNVMIKTMHQTKRVRDEEEEELLQIISKLDELRQLQAAINMKVNDDDESISRIGQQQNKAAQQTDEAAQNYRNANQFVQKRRRTKVLLFFQGVFTAIGALGGKIGAALGASFGTLMGRKVGNAITNDNI